MTFLRVLYLINTLGGGGTEKSVLQIVPRLPFVQGSVCRVFRSDYQREPYEAAGIEVSDLDISESLPKQFRVVAAIRRFHAIARREKPDLIVTSLFMSNLVGRVVGRRLRIPVISSFVDESYIDLASGQLPLTDRLKLRAFQLADAITARWVSHFIANSQAVKDSECRALGVSGEKVSVVYRGRDPGDFRRLFSGDQKRSLRAQLGLPLEGPVVINVGRLVESKGQLELIDAFASVASSFPDARLLIAGAGPYEAELRRRIQEGNSDGQVLMLGWRDDISQLLTLADVFVFPSHHEGHPGAVVEAMFASKPIIVSDIPVHRETVTHGETALLVAVKREKPLAEAMLTLLRDEELRAKLGTQARERALQLYHIDQIAEQHSAIYRNVVDNYTGRRVSAR